MPYVITPFFRGSRAKPALVIGFIGGKPNRKAAMALLGTRLETHCLFAKGIGFLHRATLSSLSLTGLEET